MTASTLQRYDQPVANDRESMTIAEDDEDFYDAVPMLYNWRLVMTPKADPLGWDYGWCYDTPTALAASMLLWNPATQNDPLGWKKRPTSVVRIAPRAEEEPEHNRPRCVHGHYLADGRCKTDRFCGVHE